jgi:type III pantothenate kinase
MKILIDVGNTRIKWAVEELQKLNNSQAIQHQKTDYIKQLKQAWFKLPHPSSVIISSVGKQQIVNELSNLANTLWPNIVVVIAKSSAQWLLMNNAYKEASKLGVDRWLGLIALQRLYATNSCVVDCGTAITIDVLDLQGQHIGGLISPGLQLMQHSLFQGTELLPNIDQHCSVGLSNYTEAAIYSGTIYAAAGLIEKMIADLCSSSPKLILTGGDAEILAQCINCQFTIEPDLVLKGLSLYSNMR